MDEDKLENALTALAIVTAVIEDQDTDGQLARQLIQDFIDEHPTNHSERLLNGLIELTIRLLATIRVRTGLLPLTALQEVAGVLNHLDELDDDDD